MSNQKLKLVAIYYGNPQSGVNKKVIYQVQGLRKSNVNAEMVFLGNKKENENFEYDFIKFQPTKTPPYTSVLDKLKALSSFRKSYEKVLLEGDDDEIIYLRNYIPARWFYKALKKTRKRVLLELPSNHFKEALLRKSYFFYLSLCLYHTAVLKNVDLIISVTQEIIDQHFDLEKYKIPHMVIGNGIQVEAVPLRQIKKTISEVFNFTCVAEVSPPHGIDRLLMGLKDYKGDAIINFHVVGKGSELQRLKDIANEFGMQNVFFHGFLSGKKLDDILEQTDLAIGALAIHRSKIKYASILKAREYCARGIPFINSGKDEEFPQEFPFVYQIESVEDPINIEPLVDFVKKIRKIPDYNTQMRKYALDVLSWDVKMKRLARYIGEESFLKLRNTR